MNFDQSALLATVIFLGGVLSTVTGGGLSMIVIVIGSIFIDVRAAIVLDLYILIANQSAKTFFFHAFTRWDVVGWSVLLGIPFAFIGSWCLFLLPIDIVQRVVAVIATLFISLRLFSFVPRLRCTRLRLIFIGAVSGFLSGATGNGAIVRKPLFSAMGLSKEVMLGTTAFLSLIMTIPRLPAYAIHTPWSMSYVVFLCIAAGLLFLSAWIGKYILRYITPYIFDTLLNVIILLGALRLLLS
ncbi:sulfite exporter TauE/SafE family protein [Candidatus Peribacteria bacterium]|nr:sulfite exporter TauE/SafE family protein [Candidatus Peribacteria bacterium]